MLVINCMKIFGHQRLLYDIVEFSVLFYSKSNQIHNIAYLVGFTIEIYYDARSYKRQIFHYVLFFKITTRFYPIVNSC